MKIFRVKIKSRTNAVKFTNVFGNNEHEAMNAAMMQWPRFTPVRCAEVVLEKSSGWKPTHVFND
jgi:hypothetical protein